MSIPESDDGGSVGRQLPTGQTADVLRHFVEGAVIGSANVIPGVSGGTMALIFGIYEDLVASLSSAFLAGLALLRFDLQTFRHRLSEVSWSLIVPLAVGVGVIIVIGGNVMPWLLETYPVSTKAVFFGLIIGSVVVPWNRMRHRGPRHALMASVALVAAFVLVGLPAGGEADPSYVAVFFAAALALAAMILPGVSGAHVLLVLGLYEPTFEAIRDRDPVFLGIFALGAGLGLGGFARVLELLLKRAHDATMAVLIGLMLGSLRALWPWSDATGRLVWPDESGALIHGASLMVTGVVCVALFMLYARKREQRQYDA